MGDADIRSQELLALSDESGSKAKVIIQLKYVNRNLVLGWCGSGERDCFYLFTEYQMKFSLSGFTELLFERAV